MDKKIVLDVKENKVDFLLALFNDLPYVKAKILQEEKDNNSRLLDEIQEAVEEVNLIKKGKLTGRPVEELFNLNT